MAVITLTQCGDRPQVRESDGRYVLVGRDAGGTVVEWDVSESQAIIISRELKELRSVAKKCKDGNCDHDRDLCCQECDKHDDCDSACDWVGPCEFMEEESK